MNARRELLEKNRKLREGINTAPNAKFEWGAVEFRFPSYAELKAVTLLFPDLVAVDPDRRKQAWNEFRWSPHSEPYRVVRSPRAVQRDTKRGVIIK